MSSDVQISSPAAYHSRRISEPSSGSSKPAAHVSMLLPFPTHFCDEDHKTASRKPGHSCYRSLGEGTPLCYRERVFRQIVLRKLTEGLLKKESPMTVVLHTINLNNEELSWGKASYPNSQGIHRASAGENIHQKNRRTSWLQSGGYFKGNQAKFQQKRNI